MVEINGERLIADLRRLAEFGKYETGVDRVALSSEDIQARLWLREKIVEAGLEAKTDRFGNVLGIWPGVERAILIGSHSDSVPRGGWLDGSLGVIYGLEIARAFREAGEQFAVGIDAISFQDEEGTYLPCLGSKSFCGILKEADVSRARSASGDPLSEALSRSGLEGEPLRAPRGRHVGFLEAHIEQGPRLISAGAAIGVVTGIVGIRRLRVCAHGRADHAGTTPMSLRRDATRPLFGFASWIQENLPRLGGRETVWNIGNISVRPGAANVVPSEVAFVFEFRDIDAGALDRIEAAVEEQLNALARQTGIPVDFEATTRIPPVVTDERFRAAFAEAARSEGAEPQFIPSGAGHDCMIVAGIMPSAMMFIPSIGGRSHDITEDTDVADIVFGCRVMARAAERLIRGA